MPMRLDTFADGLGIKRDLTEDERCVFAKQIGEIRGIVDLAAGDLINQECKAQGLEYLNSKSEEKKFFSVFSLIESMGYKFSTAVEHAVVARSWQRGERVSGLTYGHYKAVQGCDGTNKKLTKEQARQILIEAQMGYKNTKGEHVSPCPPSWVKKRRKDLEGNAKASIEIKSEELTHEAVSTLVPQVEIALKRSGIAPSKIPSLVKKVEKEIKHAHKELTDKFTEAVNAEVQKKVQGERTKLSLLIKETTQQKKIYEEAIRGLTMPITAPEYKTLRQFCHPDKHANNEDRATKAYNLITLLGERLQYIK